jgi:hypothetical protein
VRNEKVLLRVKEQRNILHEISKRKANWIGDGRVVSSGVMHHAIRHNKPIHNILSTAP